MKTASSVIYWVLSPTYKFAERNKIRLLEMDDGKTRVTEGIKKYNRYYLYLTLALAVVAGLFFDQTLYEHKHYKGEGRGQTRQSDTIV